ncbi:hypothetical protein [Mucilaginibacter sp. HD30]
MKKTALSLFALFAALQFSYAQWTTSGTNIYSSNTGNVGVGVASPAEKLDLNGNLKLHGDITFSNDQTAYFIHPVGNGGAIRLRTNVSAASDRNVQFGNIDNAGNWGSYMTVGENGNVGVGITTPQTKLHVYSGGSSANTTDQYSGNFIVEAATGGRSSTSGASLEFVVPANTDGTNPWGQARIIAVAGSSSNESAIGKMVLGTRRLFDKGTGSGITWNYGDDIVIDGVGNVGVNTSDTKGYKFAVNGSAIATSMKVKANGSWPDFVFLKNYKLPTLTEVKTYIDKNQHLPDMPSADEVHTNGLDLGEMNRLLLKKVEELTLYLMEEHSKNVEQENRINVLETALKNKKQ